MLCDPALSQCLVKPKGSPSRIEVSQDENIGPFCSRFNERFVLIRRVLNVELTFQGLPSHLPELCFTADHENVRPFLRVLHIRSPRKSNFQSLLLKPTVYPSTEPVLSRYLSFENLRTNGEPKDSGRTVVCRIHITFPFMLSLPVLSKVEGSKHKIRLDNIPSTCDYRGSRKEVTPGQ